MTSPARRRFRQSIAWAAGPVVAAVAVVVLGATGPRASSERLRAHLQFLASDELSGRGNGSPGLERAADYIAGRFREARLEPGGDNGTYFQTFPVTLPPDPAGRRIMVVAGPSGETRFRLGLEFHPLFVRDARLAEDEIESPMGLAFGGYGISAPGLGYDDYQGLDVSGRAVVVFTHEPQENDPTSMFGGVSLTPYADIALKASRAAERGARMLVVVEDPTHVIDRAQAPDWTSDPQIDDLALPVIRIDRGRLAAALPSLDLRTLARRIDTSLTPQSVVIDGATLTFDRTTAVTRARVRNVIGIWRGSDSTRAREAIVIGAHYDHLGLGGRLSMAPMATGVVHNGADDNASGTAAVLELARLASANGRRFHRTLVFVTFAAEELDLLGSKQYVRHPTVPLSRTIGMINLDMIGRAHGRVMIGGYARRDPRMRLAELVPALPLRLDGFAEGYEAGSSDDAPFARAGVPTVCFFTGFHGDYHRPSDDVEAVDVDGVAEIASLALTLAADMAGAPPH